MSDHNEIKTVFAKIGALKELFKFGGEIVPFVEELFAFLNDILPLVESMNHSLQETTSNMPKAQDRISAATQETEAATTKIMDKVDVVNQRLDELSTLAENQAEADKMNKIIQDIQNDTFEITFALQFQDITSQQLSHAQQILQTIFKKFSVMFESLNALDIDPDLKELILGKMIDIKKDTSISQASEDLIRNEGISQDDIDKLFQS